MDGVIIVAIHNRLCAIPLALCREIIDVEQWISIPLTRAPIIGLQQHRGAALPLLDAAKFLGLESQDYKQLQTALVMEWQSIRMAWCVDRVEHVVTGTPHMIQDQHQLGNVTVHESISWREDQDLALRIPQSYIIEQLEQAEKWLVSSAY